MIAFRSRFKRTFSKFSREELETAIQIACERLHDLWLLEQRVISPQKSCYEEYRKISPDQYTFERVKLQRKLSDYERILNSIP